MPTNDQIILRQLLEDKKRDLAPELSGDDYFELFSAEQVLKDNDPSYDDIQEGIVGDGGDGGIDSLFILINGEIIHEDTDLSIYRGDIAIELTSSSLRVRPAFPRTRFTALTQRLPTCSISPGPQRA